MRSQTLSLLAAMAVGMTPLLSSGPASAQAKVMTLDRFDIADSRDSEVYARR